MIQGPKAEGWIGRQAWIWGQLICTLPKAAMSSRCTAVPKATSKAERSPKWADCCRLKLLSICRCVFNWLLAKDSSRPSC